MAEQQLVFRVLNLPFCRPVVELDGGCANDFQSTDFSQIDFFGVEAVTISARVKSDDNGIHNPNF